MEYPERLSRGKGGDVSRLRAAGINGDEAYWYRRAGVTASADMLAWKAAGIDGEDANQYREARVYTLSEALELRAVGVSPSIAYHYQQSCGVTGFASLLRYAKLGCDPVMHRNVVRPARAQSGDEVVNRVLTVGDDLNRFPTGTLKALGRNAQLGEDLLAASGRDLRVAVVLAEDHYASTGNVSVQFISESIGIL